MQITAATMKKSVTVTVATLMVGAALMTTAHAQGVNTNNAENSKKLPQGQHADRRHGKGFVQGTNFAQGQRKKLTDVVRSVEKITNGVVITETSTNEDSVKSLQERTAMQMPDSKVQVVRENIVNGVKTTLTSADTDTVNHLQKIENGFQGKAFHMLKDVKRTIEKTTTGIVITETSTNTDTVKLLQEKAPNTHPAGKDEEIQVTRENITNGVKTTLSTTNVDTLKKLQDPKEEFPGMMGHHGKGMMHKKERINQ